MNGAIILEVCSDFRGSISNIDLTGWRSSSPSVASNSVAKNTAILNVILQLIGEAIYIVVRLSRLITWDNDDIVIVNVVVLS